MPKTKKERAAVSKERRLALALVALRDAIADSEPEFMMREALIAADNGAADVLKELGYSNLEGIPRQVAALTAELKSATEAGEWAKVASLGRRLDRVRVGKSIKSAAPAAGKKSSTKKEKAVTTANSKTSKADAGTASKSCAICGNPEDFADHKPDSDSYHIYRTSIKANGAVLPDNPEEFQHGATA